MPKQNEKSSAKKRKNVDEHGNTSDDSTNDPSPRPNSSSKKLKKTTRLKVRKHETSSNESKLQLFHHTCAPIWRKTVDVVDPVWKSFKLLT
jgi:hypothetical protein